MSTPPWTVVETRVPYQGRILRVQVDDVVMPEGHVRDTETAQSGHAVSMVALRPDGQVVLVSQYRHSAGKRVLELPAGGLDEGEDPADCARRELFEETHHVVDSVELLAHVRLAPAWTDEEHWIYLGTGARVSETPMTYERREEESTMEVVILPLDAAQAELQKVAGADAKTLLGVTLAASRVGS